MCLCLRVFRQYTPPHKRAIHELFVIKYWSVVFQRVGFNVAMLSAEGFQTYMHVSNIHVCHAWVCLKFCIFTWQAYMYFQYIHTLFIFVVIKPMIKRVCLSVYVSFLRLRVFKHVMYVIPYAFFFDDLGRYVCLQACMYVTFQHTYMLSKHQP